MSGKDWRWWLLLALAAGGTTAATAYAVADNNKRQRTRARLAQFVGRAWEFEERFRRAVQGQWAHWRSPGAGFRGLASTRPVEVLRAAVASINARVTWTRDELTCGTLHCWTSADQTWVGGRGDCKAMATLLVRWLADAGLFGFHVVVGETDGGGHAWVESSDGTIFMDPTAGTLFAGRPANYLPAVRLGGTPVPMVA